MAVSIRGLQDKTMIISAMYKPWKPTIGRYINFKCSTPIIFTDSRLNWLLFKVQAHLTLGQGYEAAKATRVLVRRARQLERLTNG